MQPIAIAVRCLAGGLLTLCFVCRALAAGPATDDADAPLPVGPAAESQGPYTKALNAYEKVAKAVGEIEKKHANGGKAGVKEVGAAFTLCAQSSRFNRLLSIWAEPAGVEFELRTKEWLQKLKKVRDEVREQAAVQKQLNREMQALTKLCQQLEKSVIPKATKLAEQGKFGDACKELYLAIDEIEERAIWQGSVPDALRKPFTILLAGVEPKALAPIREKAKAAIDAASKAEMPDLAAISKQAHDAAAGLASAERVSVAEQSLTGPELVTWIGAAWKQAELAALRARAGYWRSSQNDQGVTMEPRIKPLEEEFRVFSAGMTDACVKTIEADATRAAAADAPKLYVAYLAALTPIVALGDEPSLTSQLTPALDKLAANAPELEAQVKLYRRATSDLLRWRERLAASQSQAIAGSYPALAEHLVPNSMREGENAGLVQPMFSQPPSFWDSAPRIIASIQGKFVGHKVSARDLYTGANQPTTSALAQRTYVQFNSAIDLTGAIGSLKVDLLASAGSLPLTLEAAVAVDSAERGCLTRVGGTIERFELEAVATRFSMLTETDWGFVRLGDLTRELMDKAPLNQAMMRANLKPDWLCHRYFFVAVPSQ